MPSSGASSRRHAAGSSIRNGLREDRDGVLGDGELHAAAVEDRAAASGDDHVLDLLRTARAPSAPALTVPIQVARSGRRSEQEQEEGEQQPDPALDEAHRANPSPGVARAWWRSAAWGLAASWWRWRGGRRRGRRASARRRVGAGDAVGAPARATRSARRVMRLEAVRGVDGRVRLQVAHLAGPGQHEPELGRRRLDALAAREPATSWRSRAFSRLSCARAVGRVGDLAVHPQQVDVEEDDPGEQDPDEPDPDAAREQARRARARGTARGRALARAATRRRRGRAAPRAGAGAGRTRARARRADRRARRGGARGGGGVRRRAAIRPPPAELARGAQPARLARAGSRRSRPASARRRGG